MGEPHNIRRLKAAEDAAARADADSRNYAKQTSVTTWHESHGMKKTNPKEREAESATMADDLKLMSANLVKIRRERIRELYTEEMAQLQRELAARGLTIETKMD